MFIPLKAANNQAGFASGTGAVPGGTKAGPENGLQSKPEGTPNVETAAGDTLPVLGIPDSIVNGLDSPDAHVRLQALNDLLALNHWTRPKSMVSLDPLFAALEDKDEAVRAKATEIIERQWAAEQRQN